jgi:hypothetical protein
MLRSLVDAASRCLIEDHSLRQVNGEGGTFTRCADIKPLSYNAAVLIQLSVHEFNLEAADVLGGMGRRGLVRPDIGAA